VFSIRIRTRVSGSSGFTRPRSMAKGPTPASRLPQFCASETEGVSTPFCRKR